jgi:hypothetical protein
MNIERLRREQGCLTDCVAYYLNIHPENVPYFVKPRKGWNDRLKLFFKKFGYEVYWIKTNKVPKKGKHIVCGDSLVFKSYAHCVVYRAGKMAYDPNYPSKWNTKRTTHRLIIKNNDNTTKN